LLNKHNDLEPFLFKDNKSTSSSSSSSQNIPRHPNNIRYRLEPTKSNAPTHNVRRYTSENNLDQIASSSKPTAAPKPHLPPRMQTTATSTEDLSTNPSWKNLSPQARLSALLGKTNHLTSNGASASLIDLTSIDKLSSRPRFRFVPPTDHNPTLKEESEIEQQSNASKYDQCHLQTILSNRTSFDNNQNKYSHNIVKPIVIIPSMPQSAPITRLKETNIHHQNGNSAFKPLLSSKKNGLSKDQQTPPVSNIKRTESVHKMGVHVGITNPNNSASESGLLLRQQQSVPQFHQSMLNLSSVGIPETVNTNQGPAGMFGPRPSIQPTSSQYTKRPLYPTQSNQINGHQQYHHARPPPAIPADQISRWIHQVNSSSSIHGLIHPSYNQHLTNGGGGGNRPQQQNYPYGSYISTNSGKLSERYI
jgi:hypothetical protein